MVTLRRLYLICQVAWYLFSLGGGTIVMTHKMRTAPEHSLFWAFFPVIMFGWPVLMVLGGVLINSLFEKIVKIKSEQKPRP
ncbi:hypothetical protein KGO95_04120 [Patescibacteria group bacterium]|nr:hypothetical protein [Patescibacteria group bacterium]